MSGNLRAGLRLRARTDPMAAFDTLPPAARFWVAQAVLPWSAHSVRRIWRRALRETGSEAQALARLRRAEAMTLRREAGRV